MDYFFEDNNASFGNGYALPDRGYTPVDCPEQNGAAVATPVGYGLDASVKTEGSVSGNSNDGLDSDEKRKAQNRAAQRAFRERKEKRVRQLEDKLSVAQGETERLAKENELLRRENQLITENYKRSNGNGTAAASVEHQDGPTIAQFPVNGEDKFCHSLVDEHGGYRTEELKFQVYQGTGGEVLLGAGAIWQKIMEFDTDDEDIDVDEVIDYLKDKAVCDGFGPVYRMADLEQAIQKCKKSH